MKGYAPAPRELVDSSRRTAIYVIGTDCFNKMHSQSYETTRRAVAIVPLPSLAILCPHRVLQPALLLRAPIEHFSAAPWPRHQLVVRVCVRSGLTPFLRLPNVARLYGHRGKITDAEA